MSDNDVRITLDKINQAIKAIEMQLALLKAHVAEATKQANKESEERND